MKGLVVCLLSAVLCGICLAGLPFMPQISAPPPVEPVYPAGYSNNLVLCRAAAMYCGEVTNLVDLCQADRTALIRHWIEVYRTNGVPAKYFPR